MSYLRRKKVSDTTIRRITRNIVLLTIAVACLFLVAS